MSFEEEDVFPKGEETPGQRDLRVITTGIFHSTMGMIIAVIIMIVLWYAGTIPCN